MGKLEEILGKDLADLLTGKQKIKTEKDIKLLWKIWEDLPSDIKQSLEKDINNKVAELMTTFGQAVWVFENAPSGSESEKKALDKAVELMTTLEQAVWVFENTPLGSELKEKALNKAVELMTTLGQAVWVYKNTPLGSELKKRALLVMIKLEG